MNRLSEESSPYLRQHADNPVDWLPWGDEAFELARRQDRPVMLSVGYSTCHWCHVMAHESFEDEATAGYLNQHFVSVKVDREERPDVDALYMSAVQGMTGSGGWPMTVFLTPDRRPFYAGTYFPPQDMQGMPSFGRVLASIQAAWTGQRDKLEGNAEALTAHVREASVPPARSGGLPPDLLERAVSGLARSFDPVQGGFGGAPKFPSPTTLAFLLTQPQGREMAVQTLRQMLRGGIYDQLGGGFHRYSVDAQWRVPHFEKMLYDNAQLARVLLWAYTLTRDPELLNGALETLRYLEREMQGPQGGFYSAQDADSGGIEGQFFVWTPQEFRELLGPDAGLLEEWYGVSEEGNFRDPHHPDFGSRSVLHRPPQDRPLEAGEQTQVEEDRRTLLAAREGRVHPGTDDKVLTSWNGLMLSALSEAARVTGDPHWLELARRTRDFVKANLSLPDGTLRHSFRAGEAKVEGLLEDQALWGLGLVALYQAGGDLSDLEWARRLWGAIREDYWEDGVFYSTARGAETLLARRAEFFDSAVLGAHPAAAQLAVWMERFYADGQAGEMARGAVSRFGAELLAAPGGMGGLLLAAAHLGAPETEVALLGSPAARAPFEALLGGRFLPFTLVAPAEQAGGLPVLEGRGGEGVAYVCRGRACELPARDTPTFAAQLDALAEFLDGRQGAG